MTIHCEWCGRDFTFPDDKPCDHTAGGPGCMDLDPQAARDVGARLANRHVGRYMPAGKGRISTAKDMVETIDGCCCRERAGASGLSD